MVSNVLINDNAVKTTQILESDVAEIGCLNPSSKKPTVFGLWRCSTDVQDQERQVIALKEAGATRIFGDKITGTSDFDSRPELTRCLEEMQSGDLLIISELSRLSRSFLGMVNEVSKLLERGIQIKTLDNRLDTTAMPKEITMLIVSILGYAASQELAQIKTRTAEGRAVAKSRGVKFGRKRAYTESQVATVMEMRGRGLGYRNIAKSMGMSISMIRRILNQNEK
tara:strand:- start:1674 stop:2348 length:675 start_codon:yes stop_codon:yes gene_type:complete